MKKFFKYLFAFVFSVGIISQSYAENPKSILKNFAKRAEKHNVNGVLALIDGSYKQVQLIGILKQDTTQFLNELFCGKNIKDDSKFKCVGFNDIKKCTFTGMKKIKTPDINKIYANAYFKVETNAGEVYKVQLFLVRIQRSTDSLYRIAGAVG
jgi:hypothetical protein